MVWKLGHFGAFGRLDAGGGRWRGSVWKRHPGETRLEPSGQKGEIEETQTRAEGKPASCAVTASNPPRTKTYPVYSLVFLMVQFAYSKRPFAGSDLCYWQTYASVQISASGYMTIPLPLLPRPFKMPLWAAPQLSQGCFYSFVLAGMSCKTQLHRIEPFL